MATGCKTTQKETAAAVPDRSNAAAKPAKLSQAVIDSITGDWSVVEIGQNAVKAEKLPTVSLNLPDSEETVSDNIVLCYAFSGCNTINGAFMVEPGHGMHPHGDFISTLMLCPGVDYDQPVSQAVNSVKAYEINNNGGESTLTLFDGNGAKLLTLRKHNLEFLNGAWRVTRLGDQAVADEIGMEMVIDIPEGKVHANGGCNVINGKVAPVMSVDGGLKFSDMASTRMTCPTIALEQDLLARLDKVAKAVRGGLPGTALLEDARGNVLITLRQISMSELQSDD